MRSEDDSVIVFSSQERRFSLSFGASSHMLPSPGTWRGFKYDRCIGLACISSKRSCLHGPEVRWHELLEAVCITLGFESYATLSVSQLQVLIREPGTLEGRHNYVIAAVDPQRMHCSDKDMVPASRVSDTTRDSLAQENVRLLYEAPAQHSKPLPLRGAASPCECEASP